MRQTAFDMVALRPFVFASRRYAAGEYFTATPAHAAAFTYRCFARLVADDERDDIRTAPAPAAEDAAPVPTRRRRRYRRRDLTAETETA